MKIFQEESKAVVQLVTKTVVFFMLVGTCLNTKAKPQKNFDINETAKNEIINYCARDVVDPFFLKETAATEYRYNKSDYIGGGAVSYFGVSSHNHPLGHPEYAEIEKSFYAFRPTHVLFEGTTIGRGITINSPRDSAIEDRYEVGLTIWLGLRAQVAVSGWDSELAETIADLNQYYPPRLVQGFYTLRFVSAEKDLGGHTGAALERRAVWKMKMLAEFARSEGIDYPMRTLEDLEKATKEVNPTITWSQVRNNWFNPFNWTKGQPWELYNFINRRENLFRNRVAYEKIARLVVDGKRVFIVAGRTHVPQHQPALDCVAKELAKRANG